GASASTPFVAAALADGARAARGVEPRRAAPLSAPPAFGRAIGVALLALGFGFLRFPLKERRGSPPPPPPLLVDHEAVVPLVEEARALQLEAAREHSPELKRLADELEHLLQQVDAGTLTRAQAFARLAELDKQLLHADADELEVLKQKLRKAGAELGKE